MLLLFVPIIGFGQDCKFVLNEIDSFYKTKIIKTQSRPIAFESFGNGVDFQFMYDKDSFIIIKVTFGYLKVMETLPTNNLLLLLNDDNVIVFNFGNIYKGILNGNGSVMSSTTFEFKFKTSIAELKTIKDIGIKKIRFEYSDGNKEFEVSKQKFIDKTNNTINCFIDEVNKN